ncbi:hypothetical protein [Leptospira kirschneri]|uniref:hypothetical protein n=1 Tax=Leptospira kirschneri TaxID=29507 RepID=UPI001F5EE476|nr:hypothetical protein [Leptospira kirschneri]
MALDILDLEEDIKWILRMFYGQIADPELFKKKVKEFENKAYLLRGVDTNSITKSLEELFWENKKRAEGTWKDMKEQFTQGNAIDTTSS